MNNNKPVISVIVPVLNEAKIIDAMLRSVLAQKRELYTLELLVVDGGSTDGTQEIIKDLQKTYPEINLLNNEKRITPAAFNTGILAAQGEYVAILGAHAIYQPDYLDTCIAELMRNNADGCSGRIIMTLNKSSFQSTLIYHMLSSRFGVSGGSYRTSGEGFGEHCPYPLFKKTVFDKVGLYNEALVRNQDNDMNHRLREAGFRLYYTFKTSASYYPKQTFYSLLKYAYTSGIGNAISLRVNHSSMSLRHLIPFFFAGCITLGLLASVVFCLMNLKWPFYLSLCLFLIPVLLHLAVGTLISVRSAISNKNAGLLGLPLLLILFHFFYGWGTAIGVLRKPG